MDTDRIVNYSISKRSSVFRTFLILGALAPAWHTIGVECFHNAETEALAAPAPTPMTQLLPLPSSPMKFQATAYSDQGVTKSGVWAEYGIVAADPAILPLGSWIHVDGPNHKGVFRVMDTGRLIKGRIIDIYVPDIREAVEYGRQSVKVTVVKYGLMKGKPMISLN
jgi:3D (Asp-Asp-Asp) domain-containing protein